MRYLRFVHTYGMQQILKRLSALSYLARPLALAFVGIVFLSLGVDLFCRRDLSNQRAAGAVLLPYAPVS